MPIRCRTVAYRSWQSVLSVAARYENSSLSPCATPPFTPAPDFDDGARDRLKLAGDNFPLLDFHTHLKGGLTLEETLAHMRRTGINHGIAVNGGIGFPITNNAGIEAFRRALQGTPC